MKSVLILLGLFLTFQTSAQVLSLNNLITIYGKDEEEIDTYLGNKGWERAQPSNEFIQASWTYDRQRVASTSDKDGPQYKSGGLLSIIKDDGYHYITYAILTINQFNAFRAQVLALGMRKVGYTSSTKTVVAEYEGTNYRVYLSTKLNGTSPSGNNIYEAIVSKIPKN